jgi:hypothetical protein
MKHVLYFFSLVSDSSSLGSPRGRRKTSWRRGADLKPIGHYLNDREEMIEQVFSVIRGAKLRAMLTSSLREMSVGELKDACLQELEGMSKKRIRCVLRGEEMLESSDTEDDEDEDDVAMEEQK